MGFFRHFKIRTRLGLGFACILCMLLLLTVLGITRVEAIHHSLAQIGDVNSVKQRYAINFRGSVHDRAIALRDVVLETPEGIRQQEALINQLAQDYAQAAEPLQHIMARAEVTSEQERQALAQIQNIEAQALPLSAEVLRLAQSQQTSAATQLLLAQVRPLYSQWLAAINVLIDLQESKSHTESAHARDVASGFLTLMLLCCAMAVAAGVLLTWRMTRSITQPLHQAIGLTQRIAAGDLSLRMHSEGKDEIAQLNTSLAHMCESLQAMVHRVRDGAESVSTASFEIAQGNQDLSNRTEDQASALQQATVNMEQLGTTVRQNADHVQEAMKLAQQASRVAASGGEVTAQVVDTMKGISDSAHEISNIIGVIDAIAFQTNILALNAAVEAARAGEQGRGFAVVATEVRTLAQRSADAAKQIKRLIQDSMERVERGNALVDLAGQTMREVVQSIGLMGEITESIGAASTQQRQGMGLVEGAVTDIDQATQQNAALVEEMAAAASSLRQQAQDLVLAVSAFQLQTPPSQPMPAITHKQTVPFLSHS